MKKLLKPFLLMLSMMLLLQGCIQLKPTEEDTTESGTSNDVPSPPKHYYEDAVYVYQSQVDEDVLLTGFDQAYLLLANKVEILGADYTPSELTRIKNDFVASWHQSNGLYLEARVVAALYEMMDEMAAAGVTDVRVTSAYRSYTRQSQLYNQYLMEEQSTITQNAYTYFGVEYIQKNYKDKALNKLSYEDALAVVLSYSAAPGTSEHQTGLCLDFITSTMSGLDTTFENTDAFEWLSENAYKFGFILRYPKGKEAITGYTYEPWHYRFVGREAATDIYFGGHTLEEYLGKISD